MRLHPRIFSAANSVPFGEPRSAPCPSFRGQSENASTANSAGEETCRPWLWNVVDGYPLVNIQKAMENHHFSWENPLVNVYITNWKDPPFFMGTSTISMAIFNCKLLVHQRVLVDWWSDNDVFLRLKGFGSIITSPGITWWLVPLSKWVITPVVLGFL